jgi:ribonuclease BN (tRNA processing enzyme)
VRLTVLGASAVRPNPGGACAGYLLEVGSVRLLIDCGSGVLSQLSRHVTLGDLDGVIISHMHPDHCADLVFIRQELVHGVGPKRADRLPVYVGPGSEVVLYHLGQAFSDGNVFWDEAIDLRTYQPADPLAIHDLTVRFAPTLHYVPCWAMRFEHGGRSVVYGADGGPSEPLAALATAADLLLLEATLAVRDVPAGAWGHMSAAEAGAMAAAAGARRLVLIHYFAENPLPELLAAAEATCPVAVELAHEGDVFVV